MSRARLILTAIAVTMLIAASCGPPQGASPTRSPTTTASSTPPPTPTPSSPLSDLSASDIVLQLAYEPTFSTPDRMVPFGRVPPFTLFGDGQVVFGEVPATGEEVGLETVHLSAEEVDKLLERVKVLGFEDLESYTKHSKNGMTMEDASYTIIRARLNGKLREVKIYAGFANNEYAYHRIKELLREYTHPEAEPYQPETATLFVRKMRPSEAERVRENSEVEPWPLATSYLDFPEGEYGYRAWVLEDEDLTTFLESSPSPYLPTTTYSSDGQLFHVHVVPWLPHESYSREAIQNFPTR